MASRSGVEASERLLTPASEAAQSFRLKHLRSEHRRRSRFGF